MCLRRWGLWGLVGRGWMRICPGGRGCDRTSGVEGGAPAGQSDLRISFSCPWSLLAWRCVGRFWVCSHTSPSTRCPGGYRFTSSYDNNGDVYGSDASRQWVQIPSSGRRQAGCTGFGTHPGECWDLPTRWGIDSRRAPGPPIDWGGGPVWTAGGMLQWSEYGTWLWRYRSLPWSSHGSMSIQVSIPSDGTTRPDPFLPVLHWR